ncbi:Branched-chain-amino-acid aminotransferase [Hyphomicrobium sp. GJ21]|jgi:branched-chain amino acid aminotransferase|uniref:branched-chain amino acid aminotransferase n=1 Tax=Hyphomicrobium sp. GJ21 TaxID=113574 RepID=UPI000622B64B|nr:branched-chain amino acid aminotransferase [Hyphomicrobium sp. GJ21]MBN9353120.1 branched-chain amino acid aminotransferase [Hyphomicrobium denitrificans]CEJ88533.1 Branched-chain-amino-acid aminotransferase [Hyphomicrobium sp. GJ21]
MADLVPYHDRDGLIWMDGALLPWRDVKVHVLTHALHYASAVFEGERCYEGEIFKLTEHSERLVESAKILDFDIPYSVAEIDQACRDTVAANKLSDCYVRPLAWRGSEQMGVSARQTKIHLMVAAWNWGSYFPMEQRLKGIRITHAQYRRPDPACAPAKAKAAGLYMICTIEKHRAERAGYSDALMLDYRGRVAECTGANVFLIKDGVIHTPEPDCFLDGITRRTVIDLAKARGIEVITRAIMPEELGSFTECFITGTAAEITPVSEIGEHHYKPGKITETLLNDYMELVKPKKRVAAE